MDQIAKKLGVNSRSVVKRLNELKRLKLVKRDKNKNWLIIRDSMTKVLGIDEAGRFV